MLDVHNVRKASGSGNLDRQMSAVESSASLRKLVCVGEEIGWKNCKVLSGTELTSYGMEDFREYA